MRQYGLIGYPLTHSFSQKYFSEKFLREHITDAKFLNFSISKVEDVKNIFATYKSLKGLSVTIPYKKSIILYLDETTDAVKKIGACNCIKIDKEKKTGFNTDVVGFEKSFVKKLQPHHKKALVLGTGGAALAVEFVLKKLGVEYAVVSRQSSAHTINYTDINPKVLNDYNIIINCTPLGTFPDINSAPALPYQYLTVSHYLFDLVYNPPFTKFLQYGKDAGATIENGYEMLVLQAEENWKLWNS